MVEIQNVQDKETQIVRDTRLAQRMTYREFGKAVGASHGAVHLWENGTRIDDRFVKSWLTSQHAWVQQLGLRLFMLRNGDAISRITAEPTMLQEKQA